MNSRRSVGRARRWWWCRRPAILVLLGASVGWPLVAQHPPTTLTVEEAIQLARRWNPSYRRAVAQSDASGADVRAGIGQFLPSLSGSLGFNGATQTVFTGTDDFGQPVETDVSRTFRNSSSSQSLQSSITLFDGFQSLRNLQSAQAGADAARAGLDGEALRLDAEVKRRFYQVLQSQELIIIEERLLNARRQDLTATDRLFRVAARTQVDVLGAQVEVARQEQALEAARGNAQKNQLILAELIGLEDGFDFTVVGSLPEVFDPAALDDDSLVAFALGNNPLLAQAMANARQAELSASATRGQRWPTISANASVSRGLQEDGYGGLFKLNPRNRSIGFGFNVSVPLFTRFQTSQSIARAVLNQRSAEEDARAVRLQVEREARSALIDLGNSYHQVRLAERSADLARRRLMMAQEQYQVGSIDFTQLQQVVTQSATAERDARSALLSWANALVALEELVGRAVRTQE